MSAAANPRIGSLAHSRGSVIARSFSQDGGCRGHLRWVKPGLFVSAWVSRTRAVRAGTRTLGEPGRVDVLLRVVNHRGDVQTGISVRPRRLETSPA